MNCSCERCRGPRFVERKNQPDELVFYHCHSCCGCPCRYIIIIIIVITGIVGGYCISNVIPIAEIDCNDTCLFVSLCGGGRMKGLQRYHIAA